MRIVGALRAGFLLALFAPVSITAADQTATTSPSDLSTSFVQGWNLVGNSTTAGIDVPSSLGDKTKVTSVWKWDSANAGWAFYSPSFTTSADLSNYASGKGYQVLTTIYPGQGFWVNAAQPFSLTRAGIAPYTLGTSDLVKGWNLVSTGDVLSPPQLDTTLGGTTIAPSFSTMWAWDSATSSWYFYAPSLAANNTLASYIQTKSYLDFGSLTTGNGLGFWLNSNFDAPPSSIKIEAYSGLSSTTASPTYSFTNVKGERITFWGIKDSVGNVIRTTEALYHDAPNAVRFRMRFDLNGLPTQLINDVTGEYVNLTSGTAGWTFTFYDTTGGKAGSVTLNSDANGSVIAAGASVSSSRLRFQALSAARAQTVDPAKITAGQLFQLIGSGMTQVAGAAAVVVAFTALAIPSAIALGSATLAIGAVSVGGVALFGAGYTIEHYQDIRNAPQAVQDWLTDRLNIRGEPNTSSASVITARVATQPAPPPDEQPGNFSGIPDKSSFVLSATSASVSVGATVTISAVLTDVNGNVIDAPYVAWGSLSPEYAAINDAETVQGYGKNTVTIHGVATGTAQISVENPITGQTTYIPVTVTSPTLTITPSNPSVIVGGTTQLTATATDHQGNPLSIGGLTWSSSNTSVATVSSTGLVTATAVGTTTIEVGHPASGVTSTTTITVYSSALSAYIGGGTHYIQSTMVGSSCNGPINNSNDWTVDWGPLTLRSTLPLKQIDGKWVPASITESSTSSAGVGSSTYTSSIAGSGVVTTVETGSWMPNYLSIQSIETIDLNTGAYTWHRDITRIGGDPDCQFSVVETQDRTAVFSITRY